MVTVSSNPPPAAESGNTLTVTKAELRRVIGATPMEDLFHNTITAEQIADVLWPKLVALRSPVVAGRDETGAQEERRCAERRKKIPHNDSIDCYNRGHGKITSGLRRSDRRRAAPVAAAPAPVERRVGARNRRVENLGRPNRARDHYGLRYHTGERTGWFGRRLFDVADAYPVAPVAPRADEGADPFWPKYQEAEEFNRAYRKPAAEFAGLAAANALFGPRYFAAELRRRVDALPRHPDNPRFVDIKDRDVPVTLRAHPPLYVDAETMLSALLAPREGET